MSLANDTKPAYENGYFIRMFESCDKVEFTLNRFASLYMNVFNRGVVRVNVSKTEIKTDECKLNF